ncbi:hypothetical protein ACEPAF_7763 [Sanghuangporus sanghuang]
MSSERALHTPIAPPAPTPAPPGDHRKRRRNRTTQSCLNCHASKRMCDRKRPACQRCTTLGLTGLCVYEVDDPSQRNTFTDEKALLRKRVAELEGVIREMKNKPHPRWAQKPPGDCAQDQQSIDNDPTLDFNSTDPYIGENCGNKAVSDHALSVPANTVQLDGPSIQLTPIASSPEALNASDSPVTPQDPHFLCTFNLPTPPSSSLNSSPAHNDRMLPQVVVNDCQVLKPSVFNSVDSLLASACLEPSGFEDGIYGRMLDHILRADQANTIGMCNRNVSCLQDSITCGCVNNAAVYNSLLELSVRLRKAVDSLGRVSDHNTRTFGSECQLFKRIRDLDKLTSSTLGNTPCPTDREANGDSYLPPLSAEFMPTTISPNCLTNIQHWEPAVNHPPISGTCSDDSFMSWDAASRENWPHVARH